MLWTLLISWVLVAPADASALPDHTNASENPLAELAEDSRSVIRGTVVAAVTEAHRGGLRTRCTVIVEATLAGTPIDEVTVLLPGGVMPDGPTERVAGVPLWSEGTEVVVFVPWEGRVRLKGAITVGQDRLDGTLYHHAPADTPHTLDALIDGLHSLRTR